MVSEVLRYECDGAIAVMTLNRPEQFNAFNRELRAAMLEGVKRAEGDENVRVVIIKGAGRGFCAGADLAEGPSIPVSNQLDEEYKPFLTAISDGSKIYIAQVHGTAAGIGAALAMNCDLVTMADNATIYMAFAAIALIPDGGNTQLLLHRMGYQRALQAVLEGRKMPADECLSYGMTNKVFDADELEQQTLEWAQQLASGAPLAMGAAKRLLRKVGTMDYADVISLEGLEQNPLLLSQDCQTGVKAFFTKQKPEFKGQ